MKKFNVIIADDHPIILFGLRKLVEANESFNILGEASDSNQLITLLEENQHSVDLILTDYNMPGNSPYGDGLKMIEYIIRHYPKAKILVLTMISNSLTLTKLREINIYGVIQKKQMRHEIEEALLSVALGKPYRDVSTNTNTFSPHTTTISERISQLTPRELDTIRLFISGKTVNDIASLTNRSAKTISGQKISAMRKLEVESDQDLVLYCSDHNIFT